MVKLRSAKFCLAITIHHNVWLLGCDATMFGFWILIAQLLGICSVSLSNFLLLLLYLLHYGWYKENLYTHLRMATRPAILDA